MTGRSRAATGQRPQRQESTHCEHYQFGRQRSAPQPRASGWCLVQPEPGVLVQHTSSGRTCTVTPTVYPV